jgi:pilus assembly protein CpaB
MKFKKIIIVSVALLLAIFGVFLLNVINDKKSDSQSVQTTMILISPTTLQPGDVISLSKLLWKDWPTQSISKQYITKEQKQNVKDIEGAVVRYPIFEGEPISLNNVIKTGGKSILAAVIRPGMRAVSVPFNKIVNAPALILPGDVIDVVIPKKELSAGHTDDLVGQTIIRGVRVLAVDNIIQKMNDGKDLSSPRTITLEVTSDQAEDLAASIPEGRIVISMRSVFAGQDVYSDGYPKSDELPVSRGDKPSRTIALFRGSERSEVTVK